MIKYILECKNKHKFESWFSTSKEFEKLQKNTDNKLNLVFSKISFANLKT